MSCNDSEKMEEDCEAQGNERKTELNEKPKEGIGVSEIADLKMSNNEIQPCLEEEEVNSKAEKECTENDDESTIQISPEDLINFRVVWNKKNYEVEFDANDTVENLKKHIESLTDLPVSTQKLMYKGLVKDDQKTLKELNVTNHAKMMVIGSTVKDIMTVTLPPSAKSLKEDTSDSASTKEPLCKQKMHKKILDKGKPDDVLPGEKLKKEPLPHHPISGMYNKAAGKVRLTFKLEVDQLWIGTKERTERVSMGSIKNVLSEPIDGHEEYHLMAIQLGPTEASRYWLYWVPAQYVDAIKDTILGKWQPF